MFTNYEILKLMYLNIFEVKTMVPFTDTSNSFHYYRAITFVWWPSFNRLLIPANPPAKTGHFNFNPDFQLTYNCIKTLGP